MYGRKRYPSMYWLLVQAAIVFSYANLSYSKPYRQEIYQKDKNNQENNKTILHVTNNPSEHLAHLDKIVLNPSLNSQTHLLENNKDSLKTNAGDPLLQESVIFKAIISNADVLTLQEENSSNNGVLSKHSTETQQEHKDANDSSSSHERLSKAHLKWDGHVVAAPLKYDPHASNFQTPKKVSDTISTSKMVLSLLTAAAGLGSICLTVAIFHCCCRRKRTTDDEEDDDQIESDQCNKEKASVKPVDTQEQQSIEQEASEKKVCIQKADAPIETPKEQTTNGEAVQKDSEEKEEEQVSVKDKIKAFETQALKPFSAENAEQHRPLIKRPQSRVIADNSESEALSSSTTLIMGQVFRKRADTEKCQRKEAPSAPENTNTDDDYFGMIGRETEVLKSYRRAPAPRNRNKATKALYRKTMPIMDSEGKPKMEISMSDWETTVQSFHQTESPSAKQESKKTAVRLPMAIQKAKNDIDNKHEDSREATKAETKTEGSVMETVSATDTEKLGSALSTGTNTPDASSSSDEASQGEETKIKEEMKEETNKKEKEVEKVELKKEEEDEEEEELKVKSKNEEEEERKEMKKEEEEKEMQKNETEQKKEEGLEEEEKKLKEEEEKLKEEELNKEKKEKDEVPEKKEKEKEMEVKKEKEKLLKKEKELKREKDEIKREKEELNKEELKKGKEQLEKEGEKNENIFFQIDPTAEPTAAKLVKRDSGHESSETSVHIRQRRGDSPKNDQSPKSKRHLSHLDRTTMFLPPGQKPEDQMSLMMSLKERLNDKKEKNELDADTDTKMDVDPEPEMEKSEVPKC